jgi:hypothetical protein
MGTISYIISVLTVLSFPFIFFLTYLKAIEKRTQNIVAQLPTNVKAKFLNTTVWFKSFDMMKKKAAFNIDPMKTLYSFNVADLYVLNDKIIVVGKTKMLGKLRLLSPFAICWTDKAAEPTTVKYLTMQISTKLVGDDIEIEFQDFDYSNQIKLVAKKIGHSLYDAIKSGS